MYGYIYKTVNMVNGKIYVGQHKSSRFNERYLGSGKLLWDSINKYGIDNFRVEVLEEVYGGKKNLDDRERYWINALNSNNKNIGYNIKLGGQGGDITEYLNDKEYIDHCKKFSGVRNGMYGKHHSEESKRRISEAVRGKNNPMYGISLSGNLNGMYGKHHSEETRNKIRDSKLGSKLSEETKQRMKESHDPNNKPPSCNGKVFINNGIRSIVIDPNDLDKYLSEGWKRGRKSNKK